MGSSCRLAVAGQLQGLKILQVASSQEGVQPYRLQSLAGQERLLLVPEIAFRWRLASNDERGSGDISEGSETARHAPRLLNGWRDSVARLRKVEKLANRRKGAEGSAPFLKGTHAVHEFPPYGAAIR